MLSKNTNELRRGLKERHIEMIAIGGTIGVGLFLGSSTAISMAGPSIIISYALGGILVFFLLRALGEMSVAYPVTGSFSTYAQEFFSPLVGYITGWTYWSMWIFLAMAEITAIGLYVSFWFPDVPQWIPALIATLLIVLVNMTIVEIYGELEFWLAIIKVAAILFMIIMGLGIIFIGIGNGGIPLGNSNLWSHGGFFPYGIKGAVLALSVVIFSYSGVELIGVTASEAKNPQKTLPAAIDKLFWRILIFYIGSMYVILSIYPWTEFSYLKSPFVLVLEKSGISYAAGIMNLVILSAAFSSCNSGIFSTGRMIYSLACNNSAPKIFTKLSNSKVPVNAVLFSTACLLAGVFINYLFPSKAFIYLTSITAFQVLWIWITIFLLQIRFRSILTKYEISKLTYKMPLYPLSNILSILFLLFVGVAMWFNYDTKMALIAGIGWISLIFASYFYFKK
ncbi:amino acid permease [Selenomonadales bacterium OttesenSCG-928-I06]|nr:amino acid permease [Selenomonadales bacterium OttesenSCG-928-I06]